MTPVRLLSLDPAFRKFGWCVAQLCKQEDGTTNLCFEAFDTFQNHKYTEKGTGTARVRMSGAQNIVRQLDATCAEFPGIRAVFSEAPAGSQSASAAALLGVAWGAICAWSELRGFPMFIVTPQRLKIELCGKMSVSKEAIQEAVCRQVLPEDLAATLNKMPASRSNHAADAIAALWVQRHTQGYLSVLRFCE